METPSAHRKIELQDPEDLAYLIANVRRAAQARIDEAFPPVNRDDGEDELRVRIEALVEEYITKTFTLAGPNISINGLEIDPTRYLSPSSPSSRNGGEPVYEPFDERRHQRVLDLAREEEDLLAEIAALKRNVPPRVAAAFSEGVKDRMRDDEAAVGRMVEAVCQGAGEEGVVGRGIEAEGVGEEGEERWAGAVGGLGKLKREMAAVVARMERARVAGEYVVTQRR